MGFTFTFLKFFLYGLYLAAPLLVLLVLVIILLGQRVGRKEMWTRYNALYWSFITATTVGYGDFRPERKISKILAVIIALTGLIFTGIVVAIAVYATKEALLAQPDFSAALPAAAESLTASKR
jgi:voltage-gated potassium channel